MQIQSRPEGNTHAFTEGRVASQGWKPKRCLHVYVGKPEVVLLTQKRPRIVPPYTQTSIMLSSLAIDLSLTEPHCDNVDRYQSMVAHGNIHIFLGITSKDFISNIQEKPNIFHQNRVVDYASNAPGYPANLSGPASNHKQQKKRGSDRNNSWHSTKTVRKWDRNSVEKKVKLSTNSGESRTTKWIAIEIPSNAVYWKPPNNLRALIHPHEHVKDTKNLTTINWQNEA